MNSLKLDFIKKEYPYHDETHDPAIYWGQIELYLIDESKQLLKKIIGLEWDLRALVNWLTENKNRLLSETLSIGESNESIAQKLFNFYDDDELFDEELIDELYEYKRSHGLRFALRGTDIHDIYIGKNKGEYEISFYDQNDAWEYPVDLSRFISEVETNYSSLLN